MKKSKKSSKGKKPKFVFIYGAPSAGKFTVAKKIEKITDYKVFHNHDVVDLTGRFWDRGSMERSYVRCDLAFYITDLFLKHGAKMVCTHAYADNFVFRSGVSDKQYAQTMARIAKKHGYEFAPVQLVCDEKVLLKRVLHPERKKFGKIKTISLMKENLATNDFITPIKHKNNITINNTNLSAKKVAQMIKQHFDL